MASKCWASTRGEVIRVTALDSCCAPVDNTCGVVVSDGFISLVLTQEIEAAQVITVKNAADRVCVYDPGCDSLLDLTAVLTLCKINPELIGLMTGQEVVLDWEGTGVGTRRSSNLACDRRFAVEVWTLVPGTACAGTPPIPSFGYFLVPCLRSATITGDITIDGANAVSVELTAKTTVPSLWGTGPDVLSGIYNVVATDADNTPGPLLTAIGPDDHDHQQLTTIAPPVVPVDCGCTPLLLSGPPVFAETNPMVPHVGLAAAGGTPFVLHGANFTGTTGVTIGATAATGVTVVNDSTVNGITPAKTAGSYNVVITTPLGTDTVTNGATFV